MVGRGDAFLLRVVCERHCSCTDDSALAPLHRRYSLKLQASGVFL